MPRSREQIGLSFAPVVRETAPAVVNIYTRKISRRSPADHLGLRRGDIIASIADEPIAGVDQLENSLYRLPRTWRLEIDRGGRRLGVTIDS